MTITVQGNQTDTYASGTPLNSRTVNCVTGTRTNGFIAVLVDVMATPTSTDVTAVTWGGVNLAKADQTGDTPLFADAWYLLGPAGGTDDVVVSFGSGGYTIGQIYVVWGDSDSALTFGTNGNAAETTNDPAGITLTTTEFGELVIGTYVTDDNNVSTSNDTSIDNTDAGGNCSGAAYLIGGAAGSHTLDWDRNDTGQGSIFNIVAMSFYEPDTGSSPTVSQDTADSSTFGDSTPTIRFTGTDADLDDIRYNIQVSTQNDFPASGTVLSDSYNPGTGEFEIHTQPSSATFIDDRPGQSFRIDASSTGELDSIRVIAGSDELDCDGTAYIRVYAHQGTYGTSSEPLNAADPGDTPTPGELAISDGVAFLGTSTNTLTTFNFTGANRIALDAGTDYVFIVDWVPNSPFISTNNVVIVATTTTGHGGNFYNDGNSVANNGPNAAWEVPFELYVVATTLDKVSGTDAGFENLDTPADTDPFNSGDAAAFTVQVADTLDDGIWYWRVRGLDPLGTNTYGAWSSTRSFTIDTSISGTTFYITNSS